MALRSLSTPPPVPAAAAKTAADGAATNGAAAAPSELAQILAAMQQQGAQVAQQIQIMQAQAVQQAQVLQALAAGQGARMVPAPAPTAARHPVLGLIEENFEADDPMRKVLGQSFQAVIEQNARLEERLGRLDQGFQTFGTQYVRRTADQEIAAAAAMLPERLRGQFRLTALAAKSLGEAVDLPALAAGLKAAVDDEFTERTAEAAKPKPKPPTMATIGAFDGLFENPDAQPETIEDATELFRRDAEAISRKMLESPEEFDLDGIDHQ